MTAMTRVTNSGLNERVIPRRTFLQAAGLGAGGLVLGRPAPGEALADPPAGAPDWPVWYGPHSNFSARDCGLTLIENLRDARRVWKSAEATPPAAAQSPRYGGVGRHFLGPVRNIPRPLPSGGGASPIVYGGKVYLYYYVPSGDVWDANQEARRRPSGNFIADYWKVSADDVILCMDQATGRTLWKRVYAGRGLNWCDHKSIIMNQTMAAFGGRVYAVGSTGRVYCLDAQTGREVWQSDIGAKHRWLEQQKQRHLRERRLFHGLNRAHNAALSYADGVLVVSDYDGNPHGVLGFDGASGRRLWHVPRCLGDHATPTRWAHDGREYVLVGNDRGEVRCLEARTGRVLWQVRAGYNKGTISVAGDRMFVNMSPARLQPGDERMEGQLGCFRIRPTGAERLWVLPERRHGYPENLTGLPVYRGHAYLRTKEKLTIVEVATGRVVREDRTIRVEQESHAWAGEDRFFWEPDSQHGTFKIHMGTADPANFRELCPEWRPPHPHTTSYEMPFAHPMVSGRIWLRGYDGVYCYDLIRQAP